MNPAVIFLVSARRCLERVIALDARYKLPELRVDSARLAGLPKTV